ncbi:MULTISPECIES: hypothetical protein [Amniculibacterium]|jgi:hypothetical protein|uniref:hypothetical protein n=1 Tax=Amniculibacterium TaxID=2715289 RepID=UPI000F5AA640|nr:MULTISPECIES: hypothetical protein [Amniculibacterium]
MIDRIFIFIFSFFIIAECKSQDYLPKDTIYGNVKKIKEKVIFLTEIENPQLLYYDDYGHSGFMGPEATFSRFKKTWYTSNQCYYINYVRTFDKNRNIVSDLWYGKKDNFNNSYKKIYNKENKIIKEIDSTNYSVYTTNYYYSDYGDVNIIRQKNKNDYFRYTYKKFENDKLKTLKEYDENGTIDEYKYFYNESGKLKYRIYKNPNSWQQKGERTWSYGVQDTLLTVYKDLVIIYDEKNRILRYQTYDLYKHDENRKIPQLGLQLDYKYKNDNLVSISRKYKDGIVTINYFKYNKFGKVTERYCCNEDIKKATIIEKFQYKDGKISKFEYIEEGKKHIVNLNYKFDSKNNWIEIIKNVDGKDLFKWTREIEYYE